MKFNKYIISIPIGIILILFLLLQYERMIQIEREYELAGRAFSKILDVELWLYNIAMLIGCLLIAFGGYKGIDD